MINISPAEFKEYQIQYYTERLEQETKFEARIWLRNELFNLKKVKDA